MCNFCWFTYICSCLEKCVSNVIMALLVVKVRITYLKDYCSINNYYELGLRPHQLSPHRNHLKFLLLEIEFSSCISSCMNKP